MLDSEHITLIVEMFDTKFVKIWENWILNSRKYIYDLPQSKFLKNNFSFKRAKKSGKIGEKISCTL